MSRTWTGIFECTGGNRLAMLTAKWLWQTYSQRRWVCEVRPLQIPLSLLCEERGADGRNRTIFWKIESYENRQENKLSPCGFLHRNRIRVGIGRLKYRVLSRPSPRWYPNTHLICSRQSNGTHTNSPLWSLVKPGDRTIPFFAATLAMAVSWSGQLSTWTRAELILRILCLKAHSFQSWSGHYKTWLAQDNPRLRKHYDVAFNDSTESDKLLSVGRIRQGRFLPVSTVFQYLWAWDSVVSLTRNKPSKSKKQNVWMAEFEAALKSPMSVLDHAVHGLLSWLTWHYEDDMSLPERYLHNYIEAFKICFFIQIIFPSHYDISQNWYGNSCLLCYNVIRRIGKYKFAIWWQMGWVDEKH